MLKIRLSRVGKKSQPSFRVVVQEHTSAVKGKFIEELGHYRPVTKDKGFVLNLERVNYWLSKGAQPSDSMAVLLKKENVPGMEKYIAPRDKQKKSKNPEEKDKAAAPAVQAQPAKTEEVPAATPEPEAKPEEPVKPEEAPAPATPEQPAQSEEKA